MFVANALAFVFLLNFTPILQIFTQQREQQTCLRIFKLIVTIGSINGRSIERLIALDKLD